MSLTLIPGCCAPDRPLGSQETPPCEGGETGAQYDALTPADWQKVAAIEQIAELVRAYGAGRVHTWLAFVVGLNGSALPCAGEKR